MSQGHLHGDPWAASAAARLEAWRLQEEQQQAQSQETTESSWQHYDGVPDAYYEQADHESPFVGVTESMLPQQQRQNLIDHDKPPQWDGKDPQKNARAYVKLLKMWIHVTKCSNNTRR